MSKAFALMSALVAATVAATMAATMAATVAQAADPLEGVVWQTQEDDGAYAHVTIAPCGTNFCGVISRTFRDGLETRPPNLGRQIVIDMAPQGDGAYRGKVWRPSNDKIRQGRIALAGGAMQLSGCVAGGLICARQNRQLVN